MANRRSNSPRRTEALHRARIEAAVRRYAPDLWAATRRLHARWLRIMLAAAERPYEKLVIRARLRDFEIEWLLNQLEKAGTPVTEDELLSSAQVQRVTGQVAGNAANASGFLTRDPRRASIERLTRGILQDDLSAYWRSLTDPATLAKRLVELKANGVPYGEATKRIANEYGTELYRAERLIRSSYNTGANNAALVALKQAGFTRKRWLTSRDARVRRPTGHSTADHRGAEGQTVLIDEPFVVSGEELMFPGDRSAKASASNIINCRCTIIGIS